MEIQDNKITSFSSITLLLLKELRLERNIHQAQFAEICGKTPSAWAKIETGKNPLSMEDFFKICTALSVPSSAVIATMERHATLLSQSGWYLISQLLGFDEDMLLQESQEYYSSSGFRNRTILQGWNCNVSVLNSPIYNPDGMIILVDVFRFALDPEFKSQQINFELQTGRQV